MNRTFNRTSLCAGLLLAAGAFSASAVGPTVPAPDLPDTPTVTPSTPTPPAPSTAGSASGSVTTPSASGTATGALGMDNTSNSGAATATATSEFTTVDLNADGRITREEARSNVELDSGFMRFDKDKNGTLNKAEFAAFTSADTTKGGG